MEERPCVIPAVMLHRHTIQFLCQLPSSGTPSDYRSIPFSITPCVHSWRESSCNITYMPLQFLSAMNAAILRMHSTFDASVLLLVESEHRTTRHHQFLCVLKPNIAPTGTAFEHDCFSVLFNMWCPCVAKVQG